MSLTCLFDDPDFVDAEPIAVYERSSTTWSTAPPPPPSEATAGEMVLANGKTYRGFIGTIFNSSLSFHITDLPGQKTDIGEGPIFDRPPQGALHSIKVYSSRRDRFDDPVKPRILGDWELLQEFPVKNDSFGGRLPAGVPTVLAGFDKSGRVVRWTTPAKDSQGRQATLYAFAGDHYSAVRPQGKHFCLGCHPGHSGLKANEHHHAEKVK
jgi:hypothetical protein